MARFFMSFCIVVVFAWMAVGVADEPGDRDNAKSEDASLDDQLLDRLGDGLLDDLVPEADLAPEDDATDGDAADDRLRDVLGEGEDIGSEDTDPLTRIGEKMRAAEGLMTQHDKSPMTRAMQDQIVDDLNALIREARRRKPCPDGSSTGAKQPSNGGPLKQPGSGANGSPKESRDGPPRESTDRVGTSDAAPVDMDEMRDLLKEVWGHLPSRLQQQMQNAAVEPFLPKYEKLIEDYFRRLAEER